MGGRHSGYSRGPGGQPCRWRWSNWSKLELPDRWLRGFGDPEAWWATEGQVPIPGLLTSVSFR